MGAIGLTVAKLYFQRQPLRFTLWKSCLSNLTANLYGGGGGGQKKALIYSTLPSNHIEVKLLIEHSVGDHTMKNLTSIWLLSKFDWSNDPCWELLQ